MTRGRKSTCLLDMRRFCCIEMLGRRTSGQRKRTKLVSIRTALRSGRRRRSRRNWQPSDDDNHLVDLTYLRETRARRERSSSTCVLFSTSDEYLMRSYAAIQLTKWIAWLNKMSILLAGGRSATARRFSQATINATSCHQIQWPTPIAMRHESISGMGRRRALDLYGTKDVLFTHEQVKRAKRSLGSSGVVTAFG